MATINMGQLPADMARLEKAFQDAASKIIRIGALTMDQSVVNRTPVDTSRAKSNWLVSLNTPANYSILPYSPGSKGNTSAASAAAAIAQGGAVISGFNVRTDTAIWVTNNVDYIVKLNAGSSRQAPAGFVEAAVMDGVRAIEKSDAVLRVTIERR